MDPITRRHVWDIIMDAKKGRAIVLTTHSMEEADILSDRIGIMAKGRLRCIGTSIRLKSKFGTGFIANVSFSGINNGQTSMKGDAYERRDFRNRSTGSPRCSSLNEGRRLRASRSLQTVISSRPTRRPQ